jgi:hypothetical protein
VTHYVTRHGRRIEVETLDVGAPAKAKQPPENEPFVNVPLRWAVEAAKATRSPAIIVCIHLLYLAWKTKSRTVTLSNRDGIDPKTKDRVLRKLEAAGLVRAERHRGRSPRVTILSGSQTTRLRDINLGQDDQGT